MIHRGSIRTYFFHPLTDGGRNDPLFIKENLLSLGCHARLALQKCPQIRPVLPQTEWECLIGSLGYETAMAWCKDKLDTCSLGYWPQVGEGPLAGLPLIPTEGVTREIVWAREMEAKEELGLFTDLDLMAQYLHDLEQSDKED